VTSYTLTNRFISSIKTLIRRVHELDIYVLKISKSQQKLIKRLLIYLTIDQTNNFILRVLLF